MSEYKVKCTQCKATEFRKTRTKRNGHWFEEIACLKCGNAVEGRLISKSTQGGSND